MITSTEDILVLYGSNKRHNCFLSHGAHLEIDNLRVVHTKKNSKMLIKTASKLCVA